MEDIGKIQKTIYSDSEKVTLGVEIWGKRDFSLFTLLYYLNFFFWTYLHIYVITYHIYVTFKNYVLQKIKFKLKMT